MGAGFVVLLWLIVLTPTGVVLGAIPKWNKRSAIIWNIVKYEAR